MKSPYPAQAKRLLRRDWLVYTVTILLTVIIFWMISEPAKPFGDFTKAYYLAGQQILAEPSKLYDKLGGNLTFVNIPIVAVLFIPFSGFSKSIAVILTAILGGLASIAACYFTVKVSGIKGWRRLVAIGLFAINGPLYYNLKMGNTTEFVLLLLIGAVFCINRRYKFLTGVLIAIAAIIKLPFLLLGFYFILKGRWRALLGFGVTLLTVLGASLLLFGIDLHLAWYSKCIQPYLGMPLAAYNVQSVDGFLARLLTEASLQSWVPISVNGGFKLTRGLIIFLMSGITVWISWQPKALDNVRSEISELCAALCLAILISPISWIHYYLVLLLPITLYLGGKLNVPKGRIWSIGIMLSAVLLSPPAASFNSNNLLLRLFVSHYFFGGVLLLGILLGGAWYTSRALKLQDP
jgi:Glycosyltransferase family 87